MQYLTTSRVFFDWSTLGSILSGVMLWILCGILYRLLLHPLRKFPGPTLAKVSWWFQYYHEVCRSRNLIEVLPDLHRRHGPIVRIAPNHLHINDGHVWYEIYSKQNRYTKDPGFYANFVIPSGLAQIIDPKQHSILRAQLSPLFSPASINSAMTQLETNLEHLCRIFENLSTAQRIVNLSDVIRSFTADSTSQLLVGRSIGALNSGLDDVHPILGEVELFTAYIHFFGYFPLIPKIAIKFPERITGIFIPGIISFRQRCRQLLGEAKDRSQVLSETDSTGLKSMYTIFDALLDPMGRKGYVPIADEAMVDQALVVLAAGTDTAAWGMTTTLFYLCKHPQDLEQVLAELKTAGMSDGMLPKLHQLPYLNATIKESLRLRPAVLGLLPRMIPPEGATLCGTFIPGGTVVSVSGNAVNQSPEIFQDPQLFKPSRWMGEEGKRLEKFNTTFSKGTRRCLAAEFADNEITVALAVVLWKFNIEFVNTDDSTLDCWDYLAAFPKAPLEVRVSLRNHED